MQYHRPGSDELVPLLHIAPSKTDAERLLVVSPDLADVLSAIICRVRDDGGAIPLVAAYDYHERGFNPPLPLLFQRCVGTENRAINAPAIHDLIDEELAVTGLTGADGQAPRFVPHDFRRNFITDAVMSGMPPHIAQLVVGHRDLKPPWDTRRSIRRRPPTATGPSSPAAATCVRPRSTTPQLSGNGTNSSATSNAANSPSVIAAAPTAPGASTMHSRIRCPLLRVDPAQRPRLVGIRDNLIARVDEAQRRGRLGEADGLTVSLAAATHNSPSSTTSRPGAPRSTSACPASPGSPAAPSPPPIRTLDNRLP